MSWVRRNGKRRRAEQIRAASDRIMGLGVEYGEVKIGQQFAVERYKFILQEISGLNQSVYRFLGIYQTLATALVSAELFLVVNHKRWGVSNSLSRLGIFGLMILLSAIALFTVLFIFVSVLSWLDYRKEECELTDRLVEKGFRSRPTLGNWYRWYETWIVLFVLATAGLAWWFTLAVLEPGLNS